MNRWHVFAVFAVVVAGASISQAQYGYGSGGYGSRRVGTLQPYYQKPSPVTPYLNLLPNASRIGVYQGIIRPQFDQNRVSLEQNRMIEMLNRRNYDQQTEITSQKQDFEKLKKDFISPLKKSEGGSTAGFMNTGKYFPTQPR